MKEWRDVWKDECRDEWFRRVIELLKTWEYVEEFTQERKRLKWAKI